MLRRSLLALALTILAPASAVGQACETVAPGDTIRFRHAPSAVTRPAAEREGLLARGDTVTGVLVSTGETAFVARVEGRDRAFHRLEVAGIETPCSRRVFAPDRILAGVVAGGAAGVLIAWVAGLDCILCGQNEDPGQPSDGSLVRGLAIGAGIGLLGGLAAAAAGRSEPGGWVPVVLGLSPPTGAGGSWTFSLTLPVGPGGG